MGFMRFAKPPPGVGVCWAVCLSACSSDPTTPPPMPPDPCIHAAVEWLEFHKALGSNGVDSDRSQHAFLAACHAAPADLRACYAPSTLLAEHDDCRRRIQSLTKDQYKYLFERLRDADSKTLDAEAVTD